MRELMVGKEIQKIAEDLRERNGIELSKIFIQKMEDVISYKREINVGNRIADLAFLKANGNLIAIEIKANGDNLQKARDQLKDYFKWSNEVYLIVDERKKYNHIVNSKLKNDFGVIIYNQANNRFKTVKKSENKNREFKHIKPFLNKRELKNINSNNWKVVLCKGF